jgi:hypothetical protein
MAGAGAGAKAGEGAGAGAGAGAGVDPNSEGGHSRWTCFAVGCSLLSVVQWRQMLHQDWEAPSIILVCGSPSLGGVREPGEDRFLGQSLKR